jgi:hypothetical protein
MGGIKAKKLKSWVVVGSTSNKFNLCVVGATMLFLLSACAQQLRALNEKMIIPRLLMFWSSYHIDIPPQSECYSFFIGVINYFSSSNIVQCAFIFHIQKRRLKVLRNTKYTLILLSFLVP